MHKNYNYSNKSTYFHCPYKGCNLGCSSITNHRARYAYFTEKYTNNYYQITNQNIKTK